MCNFAKFYEHPLNINCQFKLCMVLTDLYPAHVRFLLKSVAVRYGGISKAHRQTLQQNIKSPLPHRKTTSLFSFTLRVSVTLLHTSCDKYFWYILLTGKLTEHLWAPPEWCWVSPHSSSVRGSQVRTPHQQTTKRQHNYYRVTTKRYSDDGDGECSQFYFVRLKYITRKLFSYLINFAEPR